MLRLGGCQIAHSGGSKAFDTCITSRHWMMTILSIEHLLLKMCRIWGGGQAVRARLSPLGVTLPHGAYFDPGVGCAALATAAETALMTPNPDSNLDRIYHSIKADFQMEPYLATLHQAPLRTTSARFRLGQHWLHSRLGRCGPDKMPYEDRWCHHCASMQHMVVDLEEHAIFEGPLYQGIRQQQPWMLSVSICRLQGFMGLPPLQQARFIQACYEQHLG